MIEDDHREEGDDEVDEDEGSYQEGTLMDVLIEVDRPTHLADEIDRFHKPTPLRAETKV